MKKRLALVLIDCLRYDHSHYFKFKDFQKLTRTVSVSNWTMPVMATMLTGLHPLEHKCCLYPSTSDKKDEVVFLSSFSKDMYGKLKVETLLDVYKSKTVVELPIINLIKNYHSDHPKRKRWGRYPAINKIEKEHLDDKNIEFLFYHSKGTHSPYFYSVKVGKEEPEPTYESQKKEAESLAKRMNPFMEKLKKKFDRIVAVSDHGQIWKGVDDKEVKRGHGWEFHLNNLHVPVWLYPDEGIEDKLYDTRIAYQFLQEEPLHSRQMVFSTTPGYGKYTRFAVSYLKDNKLYTEKKSVERAFDLK